MSLDVFYALAGKQGMHSLESRCWRGGQQGNMVGSEYWLPACAGNFQRRRSM